MISECGNCKTGFLSPDFINCPACGAKIEAPEKTVNVDDKPGEN
jgi:DNA-directed RNA polymerase subunit RPC12/RpoP